MHILHVVGARPNFMKAAPVIQALDRYDWVRQTLCHTGQHYDANMSAVFFRQLGIPEPDFDLGVGSGSHAVQTAKIMTHFEPVVLEHKPDLVLVYGDVNSTVAAALVCAKLIIPVGHVEAGLRSFDRSMPEEINRLLTDQIAELLFTPSEDANENLVREGVDEGKIHFVGNVMIDTLVRVLHVSEESTILSDLQLEPHGYGVMTLHRPSNVDNPKRLGSIMEAVIDLSRDLNIVFPVHPRTRQKLMSLRLAINGSGLRLADPLGYLDFLTLQRHALLVITDSGGIQEESTYLRVPCLTIRENTERPVTVTIGTNILTGSCMSRLQNEVQCILAGRGKLGQVPLLWDGRAAERIAAAVIEWRQQS